MVAALSQSCLVGTSEVPPSGPSPYIYRRRPRLTRKPHGYRESQPLQQMLRRWDPTRSGRPGSLCEGGDWGQQQGCRGHLSAVERPWGKGRGMRKRGRRRHLLPRSLRQPLTIVAGLGLVPTLLAGVPPLPHAAGPLLQKSSCLIRP